MSDVDLRSGIKRALSFFELEATDKQLEFFNRYLNLLNKWNKAYNLTAVRDIHEMLNRHLTDSLSVAPFIEIDRLIDVGTGPGLPGIPLAILYPEKNFHLLDSNGKKTRFLQQVKLELGLDNIEVINDRVERVNIDPQFDGVLSRAFTTLEDMLEKSEHLCAQGGQFYAMKGLWPEDELQPVEKPYKVHALNWPGNDTERHLVVIQN